MIEQAVQWAEAIRGPLGGLVAMAFGAGCVGGYGFASRTLVKLAREQIEALQQTQKEDKAEWKEEQRREREKCERDIRELTQRQRELEDMLLGRRPIGLFTEPLTRTPSPEPSVEEPLKRIP